jgi:hypothetical protein
MKTMTFKSNTLTIIAALLAIPTAYFIIANLLNEMGIPGPYNLIGSFVKVLAEENHLDGILTPDPLRADSSDPFNSFPICKN